MFRIILPNTYYVDHHGIPCKILRTKLNVVHYLRNGRTCIASMRRFSLDFDPVGKEEAVRIADEIETAEHIANLRRMKRDRNTQTGAKGKLAYQITRPETQSGMG